MKLYEVHFDVVIFVPAEDEEEAKKTGVDCLKDGVVDDFSVGKISKRGIITSVSEGEILVDEEDYEM